MYSLGNGAKERVTNIKTYARFRPQNKLEQELDSEGLISNNKIEIENQTNVKIYMDK